MRELIRQRVLYGLGRARGALHLGDADGWSQGLQGAIEALRQERQSVEDLGDLAIGEIEARCLILMPLFSPDAATALDEAMALVNDAGGRSSLERVSALSRELMVECAGFDDHLIALAFEALIDSARFDFVFHLATAQSGTSFFLEADPVERIDLPMKPADWAKPDWAEARRWFGKLFGVSAPAECMALHSQLQNLAWLLTKMGNKPGARMRISAERQTPDLNAREARFLQKSMSFPTRRKTSR